MDKRPHSIMGRLALSLPCCFHARSAHRHPDVKVDAKRDDSEERALRWDIECQAVPPVAPEIALLKEDLRRKACRRGPQGVRTALPVAVTLFSACQARLMEEVARYTRECEKHVVAASSGCEVARAPVAVVIL